MWIKWTYCDHGFSDTPKELEVPDDFGDFGGYETVEDWMCAQPHLGIPTWGERFSKSRIHWEKLELSAEEIYARKIAKLKATIAYHESALKAAQKELQGII